MADNTAKYGFRYERAISAMSPPSPEQMWIASTYANRIRIGDPVKLLATGSIDLCAAGEAVYGVVVGGGKYNDGTNNVPAKFIPGGTTWTGHHNRSFLTVMPAAGVLFEVDVSNASAYTTEALYAALVGNNADHALASVGAATDATPTLDLTSPVDTTAQWRIVGVSKTLENEDYSGANVKLLVTVNETRQAPYQTTGV